MKKMSIAYLGALLLALHLSSQVVRAQDTTVTPTNMTTMMANTMTYPSNSTNLTTVSTDNNGCGSTDAFTLLLPLALAASLLHDWS